MQAKIYYGGNATPLIAVTGYGTVKMRLYDDRDFAEIKIKGVGNVQFNKYFIDRVEPYDENMIKNPSAKAKKEV